MITGLIADFTMVLGGTIANVAIPDVMGAFGVGQDTAQFMATGYIATMTASQLLAAWFISQFGRRLSFSMILLVFIGSGLTCTFAQSIEMLIGGRIMQGFCAGVIQPLVMTTIISLYPPEQRGRAIGLYVGMLGLAVGFGPVVGGVTIDALGWRWIFMVSLPFVGVALLLGTVFIPEEQGPREKQPFDWWGYGLLCVALLGLMSAIANGHRKGWSSDIVVTYWFVGVGGTVLFIWSQHSRANRLLDFSLYRPTFCRGHCLGHGVRTWQLCDCVCIARVWAIGVEPDAVGCRSVITACWHRVESGNDHGRAHGRSDIATRAYLLRHLIVSGGAVCVVRR